MGSTTELGPLRAFKRSLENSGDAAARLGATHDSGQASVWDASLQVEPENQQLKKKLVWIQWRAKD